MKNKTQSYKVHAQHNHVHGKGCGHQAFKHGNHTDYRHGNHFHRPYRGKYVECKGPKAA